MVGLTSAAGLVGCLFEDDPTLQIFALQRLDKEIDLVWMEVVDSLSHIEALYEDETFPQRELAALVIAKVYYQIEEYEESMVFALAAGKLFDLDHPGEFEETILAQCIDTYINLSSARNQPAQAEDPDRSPPRLSTAFPSHANAGSNTSAGLSSPTTPFSQSALPSKSLLSRQDSNMEASITLTGDVSNSSLEQLPLVLQKGVQKNLQAVIRQIFENCYAVGAYRQVVGIAIEARNLEVLREAILRASRSNAKNGKQPSDGNAGAGEELLEYVLDICMNIVQERGLRNEILRLILDLLNDIPNPDYFSIAKCVVYLDQHSMASNLLRQLVERGDVRSLAIAYQISFDLYDNSTQEFLANVMNDLPETEEQKEDKPTANGNIAHTGPSEDAKESDPLLSEVENRPTSSVVVSRTKEQASSEDERKAYGLIRDILRGTKSIELHLEFLFRNNRTDRNILNKIRDSLEARNSIFHSGVTFANAFMNSGTTNDSFFRDNLEWLSKAVNWSKFSATAALGAIHRGNLGQGQNLLKPYLPQDSSSGGSPYSQGGSLYALGLIYTNHGHHVLDYLRDNFKKATEEVVQHGGALGLGVAGMATGSEEIYEELRSVLYSDSAINGEAVGLSMGLVMLGTGSVKVLEDMIQYAHDTQHEKIVRGLAMGMALIMYARQEAADELINGLLDDPDPTLRYGGILTVALAYCGTGSNKAVRRLLHVAVSDVNDDVRRVAVMSLGFVLFRKPGSVPQMVELLSESYNPHVRYGASMALGIACAGTGLEEAIDLLEPMMKDSTDFVRQGALISLSMIMVQQNEVMNPKVTVIRKSLQKIITDRHEDAMAKFGCALALGIIDAGGRNCTIGLQTQTGNLNMAAIVGMAVFTQYWFWFPLTHFLSLSFTPTAVIGVDQDLEIPKLKFHSATKPSMFDYPPEQEVKMEEAPEKVKTAVLSTTAQAKRRKLVKERLQRRESMDNDQTPTTPRVSAADDPMDTDGEAQLKNGEDRNMTDKADTEMKGTPSGESLKKRTEKEKVGYDLENMSRVLPAQLKYFSFPEGRYTSVKKPSGGVSVVIDSHPENPKELLDLKVRKAPVRAAPSESADQQQQQQQESTPVTSPEGQRDMDVDASGAAAGAGVLTAIDEDEDGEEAEVPQDFDLILDEDDDDGSGAGGGGAGGGDQDDDRMET